MPEREYYVWDKEGEEYADWVKFYYFSEAYRKSSLSLLKKEQKGEGVYGDEEILPVLMLFSQYLELSFKTLLIKKGVDISEMISHSIKDIYEKVREQYPDFSLDKNSVLFLEDFEWMNKFGQSLRYPVSSRGERLWLHSTDGRFFSLSGISTISIKTMNYILDYIRKNLFNKN